MQLRKTNKVCAMIDIWSSRQMWSYFSITGHFIVDWELQSVMLVCMWFQGSYTANAIAELFDGKTAVFDLTNKILHIVTDNDASMLKAFMLSGFEDVAPDVISDDSSDDDDTAFLTVMSDN